MIEIWKEIKGYEGYYEISNFGRVRSMDRVIVAGRAGYQTRKGKIMKLSLKRDGYVQINLRKNNISKYYRVHRLVALTFLEKTATQLQVNHKNGIKIDNSLINLEWCTCSENVQHSHNMGLSVAKKGSDNNFAKLNEKQVRLIKLLLKNKKMLQREIADLFGVTREAISQINIGNNWGHINV